MEGVTEVIGETAMQKSIWLLGVLAFLCSACVGVSELPEPVKIHGLLPQDTRSIVIQSIPMKPGTTKNVEGLTDAPQLFTRYLKEALALKQPSWQIKLAEVQGVVPAGDITVITELREIDGGSAGLRFWIGFSAGEARSTVKISILDKTGKDLATANISERSMCPIGACVGSNEGTIRRNLQNLAGEAAEFIVNPAEYEKRKESES